MGRKQRWIWGLKGPPVPYAARGVWMTPCPGLGPTGEGCQHPPGLEPVVSGAPWTPVRAVQLGSPKQQHWGQWGTRAQYLQAEPVGGERMARSWPWFKAERFLLPEAGVKSTGPPEQATLLTTCPTWDKMMQDCGSAESVNPRGKMSARPTAGTSDVLKETYFPVKSTFSISTLVGGAELLSASVCMRANYTSRFSERRHTLGFEEQLRQRINLIGNTKQTNKLLPTVKSDTSLNSKTALRPCFSVWYRSS